MYIGSSKHVSKHSDAALGRRCRVSSPFSISSSTRLRVPNPNLVRAAPNSSPPPPAPALPPVSPLSVLVERLQDTVDDVALHLRRAREHPIPTPPPSTDPRPHIVVLGSGWGAHSLIKIIDTSLYRVTCISPRNHFAFTPMLPSCAVGTVEIRSVSDPIRVANPFIEYLQARAIGWDAEKKTLTCVGTVGNPSGGDDVEGSVTASMSDANVRTSANARRTTPSFQVSYDKLVISIGEVPATFGVPGVAEHCVFLKEPEDAVRIRRRIGECFEYASLPTTPPEEKRRLLTFCVVGGGPTGVEFMGILNDYIVRDLKPRFPLLEDYVSLVLLQSGQTILTQFTSSLQQQALDNFARAGIRVQLGVKVVRVEASHVELADGTKVDCGMCLWSAGNASNPFTKTLMESVPEQRALLQNRQVKLAIDPYCRVIGARDVLAVGDCTTCRSKLPATAQVASQQAAYVGRLLNRGYAIDLGTEDATPPTREQDAQVAKPFRFLSLGILAYIGSGEALTQIGGDKSNDWRFELAGKLGTLLYASVYLTKQVSFRNRVLILIDWMRTKVFGRDLTQF